MSFMSITGRDLNRDTSILNVHHPITPTKKSSRITSRMLEEPGDSMELETTLAEENYYKESHNQFGKIADNVNNTIHELSLIYNQIGYSSTETAIKKSEIFSVIQDTITNFTTNLQREKSNIENECEWLRQQIRIIIAMMDDNNGSKTLSLMRRGMVFNDQEMYERGFKEDILTKISKIQNRKQNFYASSPFNVTSTVDKSNSIEQYEYMMNNIPELSLLQQKSKLNGVFLDVLKNFIDIFKKFTESNLIRLDILESIGEYYSSEDNDSLIGSLPSRTEADEHRELIDKFESIVDLLRPSKEDSFGNADDNNFIISSPRKNEKLKETEGQNYKDQHTSNSNNLMGALREVNYKIVRVIRNLKVTKINNEVLDKLRKEIESCETELNSRMSAMQNAIDSCFELIETLHLNEEQLVSIQRKFDINASVCSDRSQGNTSGGCLDSETLRFIQNNPREFGLSDNHLGYINSIAEILSKIKDAKQSRWDNYFTSCSQLWDKLREDPNYVESFIRANSELTDISLLNFKVELNRLYVRRSEFIESFIADARKEIEELNDLLFKSETQRESFKYHHYNQNNSLDKETVLNDHEAELSSLKEEYQSKSSVLGLYTQLNELLKDQRFLQESSKDSSRLLSKNSCKILLNEEKIRKKINKGLPNIIKQLKSEVIKYNNAQLNEGNKPMTIHGEDFFEKIIMIESQSSNRNVRAKPRTKAGSINSPNKVTKAQFDHKSSPIKNVRSPGAAHPTFSSTSRNKSPLKPSVSPQRKTPDKSMSAPSTQSKNYDSSMLSPMRATRHLSNLSNLVGSRLKPLNTPLIATDVDHYSDVSVSSKLSPLKTSFSTFSASPTRDFDDKENSFCNKYSLSPIKPSEYMKEEYTNHNENTSLDSSTIIGDEYQMWRNERIRQLNSLS
ncbi:hypothetical protein CAAN1_04S07712 [[Candida] anglica]|uniref:Uncharacterized protein n=1 Tax=[Candida] anglica TaxID=148631 RepID=A0ABP0E9L2_9ASCO